MIALPDQPTEMPPSGATASDLLSDVLRRVRLSGAIFLRGEYAAPWAFDSPAPADLVRMLAPDAERLVLFHIVRHGSAWVEACGRRVKAQAGDLVVLPHADRHQMGHPDGVEPVPIATLLPPPPWQSVPVCRFNGGGEPTGVVCGYLRCDELLFNTLLRCLPPLFRVRPAEGPGRDWVGACIDFALDESAGARGGSSALMARLPELLLVEALRLHAEQGPAGDGWLAAIQDPVVGRALALLHADVTHGWTLEELAERAASSRSVLDERFRRLLGQPPMRYLTLWRMQLASEWLRSTPLKLADIAERAGYGSEEAFSRAFRRHVGITPAQWRSCRGRSLVE